MLKYLALTRLAIQRQFVYRAATLAGLATNVFFGLLRAAVASREGNRVTYRFDRAQISASELIARVSGRFRIIDLQVREPDIADTVRRIYEQRLLEKTGVEF